MACRRPPGELLGGGSLMIASLVAVNRKGLDPDMCPAGANCGGQPGSPGNERHGATIVVAGYAVHRRREQWASTTVVAVAGGGGGTAAMVGGRVDRLKVS